MFLLKFFFRKKERINKNPRPCWYETALSHVFNSDTHLLVGTKDIRTGTCTNTHTNTHIHRASVTVRAGERGLKKHEEMKSVFESKQRQSDQEQTGADQTVVLN